MRIPNLGETELLVPLHEGMFEQPMWRTFLDRMRGVAECEFATLIFRPTEGAAAVHLSSGSAAAPPRLLDLFDGKFGGNDPLQSRAMREGRVYTLEELIEAGGSVAQSFADEMLAPLGLYHLRSMRICDDSGLDAWIVLASGRPMTISVANLLTALIPHLRVALKVLAMMERERARASMNAGAFSHIDFGWISVDAKCRIVDMDEQAHRFLGRSAMLHQGPYGRLTPSSPAIDRQLTALVKEFAENPDARPRAVNLSEDPWIDILVSPVRVAALTGGGEAVAVVYFRGEQSSSADRCQQLIDVFNLTQSEARFAWSIAQGMAIAEAAEKHGLTIETARNYSKKIYAKAGAKGQVDFMRRILTSVVALTVH